MDRGAWQATVHGIAKVGHDLAAKTTTTIEKNEILPFTATWMDLEIVLLSEVNQTEREKYHMISIICRL